MSSSLMGGILTLLKNKWISPPKPVTESYSGRNIIVTGSTSGIGFEAVVKFAALGASKIIIAARDVERGEMVKTQIESRTGKKGVLEVWELDMASYESVVSFAKRAQSLDHLDIAVLNAGIRRNSYTLKKHGWEEDIQVNTLSTTLLAILILPKLKESKRYTGKTPILEFTSSGLHQKALISPEVAKEPNILQYYNKKENFKGGSQYKFTKLFLMYATNELAAHMSSGDVIITSIGPGLVKTELTRDYKFPGAKLALAFFGAIFMRSPSQGANSILSGTTQGEAVHGRFWQHDQIQPLAPSVAGEDMRRLGLRVWNEIVQVLEIDVPEVTETLKSTM